MTLQDDTINKLLDLLNKINEINENKDPIFNLRTFGDQEPKNPINYYFSLEEQDKLINIVKDENNKKRGSHISFNYSSIRKNQNEGVRSEDIKKLNFIFIDIDFKEENEQERIKIISDLEYYFLENQIEYCYKSKGRAGFHYLIPINLENNTTNNDKIRQFVEDIISKLKTNSLDTQTLNPSRLFRMGGTFNFKEEEPILNKIEHCSTLQLKSIISSNNDFITSIKVKKKNIKLNHQSVNSINNGFGKDFFKSLLNDKDNWEELRIEFIEKARQRNQIFLKNLSIFIQNNNDYLELAGEFLNYLNDRKKNRISQLKGYLRKSDFVEVNIQELFNWISLYDLEAFKKYIPNEILFFKLECQNEECRKFLEPFNSRMYKKSCPHCNKKSLIWKNEIEMETYFIDSLSRFRIYNVRNKNNVVYLLRNEEEKKHFVINGSSNLGERLYLDLRSLNVNCEYLRGYFKNYSKNIESLLIDYIKSNLEIKPLFDLGFRPIKELMYFKSGELYFNDFRGNKYLNFNKKDIPKDKLNINLEKECPNIHHLLSNLTGFDEESFNYLCNYLSFCLQFPYIRTQKVISFYGDEATGKGIFYDDILNVLFNKYCQFITMKTLLKDDFNSHYSKSLFVFVDEARYVKSIEQEMLSNTTANEIQINNKNGTKGPEEVFFNYICASNEDIPMKVGNRRGIYFKSSVLGGSEEEAKKIGKQFKEKIPKELDDFFYYLLSLNPTFDLINEGIENEEKEDIMNATKSFKERFVDEIKNFKSLGDFVNYVNHNSPSNDIQTHNYILEKEEITYFEVSLLFDLFNAYVKIEDKNYNLYHNKMNFIFSKLDIDKEKDCRRMFNRENRRVLFIDKDTLVSKLNFEKKENLEETLNKIEEINLENTLTKENIIKFFKVENEIFFEKLKDKFKNFEEDILVKFLEELKKEGVIYEPKKNLLVLC